MKRLLIGAAALACIASPAAAATITWQGDLFITAVNNATACNAVGMNVGGFARGVFRPRNVVGSTNGTSDVLAVHFGRSAFQLAPNGPSLDGATAATIRYIYGSGGFLQFTNVALTGADVVPNAGYNANTPTFNITLTITGIYPPQTGPSGCNATFKGTLAKKLS